MAAELGAMRQSLDAFAERFELLVTDNARLQARLDASETARADLLAQSERLIELLAETRRELWQYRDR
ncbi:MAG: hypothetical protein KDC98_00675 [Planctomycetes bacterium]|nr:hypothetical protein [Planctomycetota bacterium]